MPVFSAQGDKPSTLLVLKCPSCGKVVLHPVECGDIFCQVCPMRLRRVSCKNRQCKEHFFNKCPECRGTAIDDNGNTMKIGGRENDEYHVNLTLFS